MGIDTRDEWSLLARWLVASRGTPSSSRYSREDVQSGRYVGGHALFDNDALGMLPGATSLRRRHCATPGLILIRLHAVVP
jgi:hypothetical protein